MMGAKISKSCLEKRIRAQSLLILLFIALIVLPAAAAITYSPSNPNREQEVSFRLIGQVGAIPGVEWEFRDGTVVIGGSTTVHTYIHARVYTVKAVYVAGAVPIIETVNITISENRKIDFNPRPARLGVPVVFQARNFLSESVVWDFGDGTPMVQGAAEIFHAYGAPGLYVVTVSEWRDGRWIDVSVSVEVLSDQGSRAKFNISYINLSFEEGKPYAVVVKGAQGVAAIAGMKFEGTGIFYGQWKVDGHVFRTTSRTLNFAEDIQIESGEPGLPTLEPGIHEVTLDVLQPNMEYKIPSLHYFVIAGEPESTQVAVKLIRAVTLSGEEMPIDGDVLEAAAGEPFIIQGEIRERKGTGTSPHVLLRIYLGNRLIDNQLHAGLAGSEIRSFETSVSSTEQKAESLFITLYDIGFKPPILLAFREILLHPGGGKAETP